MFCWLVTDPAGLLMPAALGGYTPWSGSPVHTRVCPRHQGRRCSQTPRCLGTASATACHNRLPKVEQRTSCKCPYTSCTTNKDINQYIAMKHSGRVQKHNQIWHCCCSAPYLVAKALCEAANSKFAGCIRAVAHHACNRGTTRQINGGAPSSRPKRCLSSWGVTVTTTQPLPRSTAPHPWWGCCATGCQCTGRVVPCGLACTSTTTNPLLAMPAPAAGATHLAGPWRSSQSTCGRCPAPASPRPPLWLHGRSPCS